MNQQKLSDAWVEMPSEEEVSATLPPGAGYEYRLRWRTIAARCRLVLRNTVQMRTAA